LKRQVVPKPRSRSFAALAITLAAAIAFAAPLMAQEAARYLDKAPAQEASVRLVIFNPETFNIRALVTLRKNGTLDVPNLTVIGVYHVRQTGNFAGSRQYVVDNGLDWFKFHEISAVVEEKALFGKNAWTPDFELIIKKADGVIFFGGPDIPPAVFGEKTNLLTEISDPYRHWLEASAVFHLLGGFQDEKHVPLLKARPGFPVLGICLGHQTLNVGTGGTLVQDIWSEVYAKTTVEDVIELGAEHWHNSPFRRIHPLERLIGYNFHSIDLDGGSLFVKAMGFKTADHPRILSSHHQAVGKPGKGLVAAAWSRDRRVVEAVQHTTFPNVLGVQFHPEHPLLFDAEPQHRQKPGDEPTSFRAILEGTPPSLEFNQAIWGWFGARLIASRGR
jgi:putative glutamine amidotransferase